MTAQLERACKMGINPIEISGNWDKGYVLDQHVLKSVPIGENVYGRMEFDTIRTELGELLFLFKYRNKADCLEKIVELIKPFLDAWEDLNEVDIVLPVPPTKPRAYQPATEIARSIAEHLGVSFIDQILEKTSSEQAKDAPGTAETVKASIKATEKATREHTILLVDDLYGTGNTMRDSVTALKDDPKLTKIFVLAMTKKKGAAI